jgi:WD40 repeat protein
MSATPKFCANCGAPAVHGDIFCGTCGYGLTAPVPTPGAPAPAGEAVVTARPPKSRPWRALLLLLFVAAIVAGFVLATQYDGASGTGGPISAVAFDPSGKTLAVGTDTGALRLVDPSTGAVTATNMGSTGDWSVLAFSRDGRSLAAARFGGPIAIVDVATGTTAKTLVGHNGTVGAMAFSAESDLLFSADLDRTFKVWEWPGGSLLGGLDGFPPAVRALVFSADSELFGWATADGRIDIFTRINMETAASFSAGSTSVEALALRPDRRALAVASGTSVSFVSTSTGRQEASVDFAPYAVRAIAFSPDGATLAVGLDSGEVRIVDSNTRKELRTLSAPGWWQRLLGS